MCVRDRLLVEYLRRKAGPAARVLSSLTELVPDLAQLEAGALSSAGVLSVLLGVFPSPGEGEGTSPAEEVFRHLAQHYEAGIFYLTHSQEIAAHFGLQVRTPLLLSSPPAW